LLNTVEQWYDASGPEWTNSRIKDLRQWYETCLAGKPTPPEWFKHTEDGYPKGIWKWVFNQKPAKALGVLSMNTVFYESRLSDTQKEKFLKGIHGNQSYGDISEDCQRVRKSYMRPNIRQPKQMPPIHFPTILDMTGSIPVMNGHSSIHPNENLGLCTKALQESWKSVPQITYDFLDDQDYLDIIPEGLNFRPDGGLALQTKLDTCIGRVSVLQQPQLKARTVGNPNRVLQATLEPLKSVYMQTARKLPTDVTHDQISGVAWVQHQLRHGRSLSGSDLTSASDLLEVSRCLDLVNSAFGFRKIEGYRDFEAYFLQVCRSDWYCPSLNKNVKWEQGTVLGTGPSFGLLTLTNNVAAYAAIMRLNEEKTRNEDYPLLNPENSFRVLGDDIIMLSEILPYYEDIIQRLGGEINHSKTLTSDRVAEFAGRVITSDSCYLKAIKYSEPSDNSFMSYVAQLGDQAKYLLKPKQRQVYEFYKFVPGIAVDGAWMPDSYGVALGPRYQWYLSEVEPALKKAEPDLQLKDYELILLKGELSLAEANESSDSRFTVPTLERDYLSLTVTPTFKVHGDPRLTNGKSTLDVLYQHMKEDIMPYEEWYQIRYGDTISGSSYEESTDLGDDLNYQTPQADTPDISPVNQKKSSRSSRYDDLEI
jgi:hypothetical protein